MGAVVSVIAGVLLALAAGVGLVNSASSTPPAVDAPYITYGTS